jgi:hypothetical protein
MVIQNQVCVQRKNQIIIMCGAQPFRLKNSSIKKGTVTWKKCVEYAYGGMPWHFHMNRDHSLKKFLIVPWRATIYENITFTTVYTSKSQFYSLPPILPASPVAEQTAEEKLASLVIPWQPRDSLFSPGSRPHTTKIGRGHTENESQRWAKHRLPVLNSSAVRGNTGR